MTTVLSILVRCKGIWYNGIREEQRYWEERKINGSDKKRCYRLNDVSVNISRGLDWNKMKKDIIKKRKLEINHPE